MLVTSRNMIAEYKSKYSFLVFMLWKSNNWKIRRRDLPCQHCM